MIKQPDNFNKIEFYKSLFQTAVGGKAVMGYLKPAGVFEEYKNLYDILFWYGQKVLTKFMKEPMVYDCRYTDCKKCINFGKRPFNLSKHPEFKDFYKNVFEKLAYASMFRYKNEIALKIQFGYESVCDFGCFVFEKDAFMFLSNFPKLQALYFNVCDNDKSNRERKSDTEVRNSILNNEFATFKDKVWCKSPSLDKLDKNINEDKCIINKIKNDINIENPNNIIDKAVAERVNNLINDLNKEVEPLKFKSSADDVKNAWINWCKSARLSK